MAFRNKPYRIMFRRQLRRDATAAEVVLWNALRGRKLQGRRFRRQDDMGPYIVDFICVSEKLVIEVDGWRHFETIGAANDAAHDDFIRSQGFQVLHFENKEVFDDLEGVLIEITRHFKK